jgi:His Kinase A (phospho-acceptor) domain
VPKLTLLRLCCGRYRTLLDQNIFGVVAALRVDDRLSTALRNVSILDATDVRGKWHQLIDILAQNPDDFDQALVAEGLVKAYVLGQGLTVDQRVSAVRSLGQRIHSAPLVQLLGGDVPAVAAAAISGARLSDEEWSELVPELPVRARGFLRARSDLGQKTQMALAAWAGADFRLSGTIADIDDAMVATPEVEQQPSQIGAIVERIEQWRRNREAGDSPRLPLGDEQAEIAPQIPDEIRFETDDNGTICWVEGAPRGAIVGIDIAHAAYDGGPGPDAYGAAAFRQRMPMENARMQLRGGPIVEGDWLISASPFFDAITGRFRGFRGIMRRPNFAEKPEFASDTVDNRRQQGESMQQIVHELRTPLGAIAGFAEIIEQQLFGPVTGDYRSMAGSILADAHRLLAGFDDLATAARLDAGNFDLQVGITDCAWLAEKLAERLAPISDGMGAEINLVFADPVRPFAIERELAERIFSRLLSAVIIGCRPGEALQGRFKTELGRAAVNSFQLGLPEKLVGRSDDELLGTGPVGNDDVQADPASPLLGLGFSLRLVRNLARKVGGDLRFQKESLLLTLPAVQDGNLGYRDYGGD